ncbi:helix-turn-helix transcriptional regulator [Candidatus Uhrbacteria bacterium]|nr:helix-turn-helix transcriptional regulator [Candidatus Uhrbacteria bacterium]
MKSYKVFKSELLKNKEIKKAYDELGPEFLVIEKLIERRLKNGLSQNDLAQRVGTKQSAISRFESGSYNPTISFLYKVADALDTRLKITVS